MKLKLSYLLILVIISSCHRYLSHADRVIIIQPFEDFSPSETKEVFEKLKKINPNTILRTPVPLPLTAFYSPRNRYRADSLINYLNHFGSIDTVIIGLTGKDISTTHGDIKDWGIMGLGFCPGNACIASTFRLSNTNLSKQFYKVAVHELGHTQGLPHCNNKICFMRDAEGGNHLNEEIDFCPICKSFLKSKGWRLE